MENKWRIFVDVLTAISVVAIIVNYLYPNLSIIQRDEIYFFDLFVVAVLAVDFYNKIKKSDLPLSRFLIGHWYEIPAMMPLILFSTLEHEFFIGVLPGVLDYYHYLELFFYFLELSPFLNKID